MVHLLLFLLPFTFMAAKETAIDDLILNFDKSRDVSTANALFAIFQKEGITESQLLFDRNVSQDSLQKTTWYWTAEYLYSMQDYSRSTDYALKALPLLHSGNDRQAESDCLSLIAISYFGNSEYQNAAKFAKMCYSLDKQSGDASRISSSLNTITAIYLAAKQPKEAEKYILKAISVNSQVNDPKRMATLKGIASEVYHQLGDDVKALEYAQEALSIDEKLGNEEKIAIHLSQMASAYIGIGQMAKAKEVLLKAIKVFRKYNNDKSLGISYNQIGEILLGEGQKTEARTYFEQAATLFKNLGDMYNESRSRLGLYNSLKDTDASLAMQNLERYNALKDSIYTHETGKMLSEYSVKYGNEQLLAENQQVHHDMRTIMIIGLLIILFLIALGIFAWIMIKKRGREYRSLNDSMDQLKTEYGQLTNHYQNAIKTNKQEYDDELSQSDKEFLEKTVFVINEQIDKGQVDVDTIAQRMCLSSSQFRRRLTVLTGERPQSYIQGLRMQKARHLLDNHPNLSIADVAIRCGYDENSNFTRSFKRVFGMTPSEYQSMRKQS